MDDVSDLDDEDPLAAALGEVATSAVVSVEGDEGEVV